MESLEPIKNNSKITLAEKTSVIWRNKYDLMQVNSFPDCFPSEENKTLKNILRENLEKPAKYLIYDVVLTFAASFNLTNNFREDQIQDFVNDIFEFYPHLTVRDIKFFLKQVKAGNFGQIYNRLDGPLLFGYLKVYNDLRIGEAERHESNLTKAKDIEQYDERIMLKRLAPLFQKKPEPIEQSKKVIEPDETYLKIHKDFCSLHAKQGSESGTMFVKYNGKMMNFEEYYNAIIDETFET
jgi:hypothetical protein